MLAVALTIIVIAIALFIVSFFVNDKYDKLESNVEDLSVSLKQDTYQLRRKIKVLEEEINPDNKKIEE